MNVTTADVAMGVGEIYFLRTYVEGFNAGFLGFGQAGLRWVTISFWCKHTVAGVYPVQLRNSAGNRAVCGFYTQNVTNTWEFKSITLPVDTTGTWLNDNGAGLVISFPLAADFSLFAFGSYYNYQAGDVFMGGTPAIVNAMGTIGNRFRLALVQIEEGPDPSAFEQVPQDAVLQRCERYFSKSFNAGVAPAQALGVIGAVQVVSSVAAAVNFGADVRFRNRMRADADDHDLQPDLRERELARHHEQRGPVVTVVGGTPCETGFGIDRRCRRGRSLELHPLLGRRRTHVHVRHVPPHAKSD